MLLTGLAVAVPVIVTDTQLFLSFTWKWFLLLGIVIFVATFCATVLANLVFRKKGARPNDHLVIPPAPVQPMAGEPLQTVTEEEKAETELSPTLQPRSLDPSISETQVANQPIPEASHTVMEDMDIGTLILRSYTEFTAKEHLLRGSPVRVSVCNYEQVSNRVYGTPRFIEDIRGFYCMIDSGEVFPHPDEFNGYYTPHLLQGTLLLDTCFSFDGDKRRSGIVIGMQPAFVHRIGDGQYELRDQGMIKLQGEKVLHG